MELTDSMLTTSVLPSGAKEKALPSDIRQWIDSNMYYADSNYVWRIGITTAEKIVKIEALIRQDLQCKHWKYWRASSFRGAMKTIRDLNCYPFVFKSLHNNYLGKGMYVFTYKTTIAEKSLFYHTLHS